MNPINRNWLERVNPDLLTKYQEVESWTPSTEATVNQIIRSEYETPNDLRPSHEIHSKAYKKQFDLISKNNPPALGIICGTDGGYLIEKVSHLKHLIIVEPNVESFNHSLKVVDWPQLLAYFHEKGGSVFIHIGKVTLEVRKRLSGHMNTIGVFNTVAVSLTYDGSTESVQGITDIMQNFQECVVNYGFFDDELVSLSHTIENFATEQNIQTGFKEPWIERPVVVVGNGPSLTDTLPEIKKLRDSIYLVSCGTALGTLYRHGIKPDIHTEKERPRVIRNWIARGTTPEYRKGITFVGLNVVHPDIPTFFDESYLCLKPNDLGASIVKDKPRLPYCAPMAANFGAALCASLGFKNIYLAGCDCAFAEDGRRHPKGHREALEPSQDLRKLPGNLRDEVTTNAEYNRSRKAFEILIHNSNGINYYNLSDGARILGALPMNYIDAKGEAVEGIFKDFEPYSIEINKDALGNALADQLEELIYKFIHVRDIDKLYQILLKVEASSPLLWGLVKGSLMTQLTFMAGASPDELEASHALLIEFMRRMMRGLELKNCVWESNGGLPDDVNRIPIAH